MHAGTPIYHWRQRRSEESISQNKYWGCNCLIFSLFSYLLSDDIILRYRLNALLLGVALPSDPRVGANANNQHTSDKNHPNASIFTQIHYSFNFLITSIERSKLTLPIVSGLCTRRNIKASSLSADKSSRNIDFSNLLQGENDRKNRKCVSNIYVLILIDYFIFVGCFVFNISKSVEFFYLMKFMSFSFMN